MRNRLIRNDFIAIINNHIVDYPTPITITYFWSFGCLAGFCLVIQLLTGIFLAMHYTPHIDYAFASVEHIMRDVNYGWLMRYTHANGASMFFLIVYVHIFRGIYYGSYMHPRQHLWYSGILIYVLMMATGFLGYVLPWGQMSFWGATVITNLFGVIPFIGADVVSWLWGGFSIDNATLNRFFSFHYLVPFLIAAMAIVHLALLHEHGSGDPIGCNIRDYIPFFPYCYTKDLYSFFLFIVLFSIFVFFSPNTLGHPDNYIMANPMVTPSHIVPEWYFLPFYAILRSIPNKLFGVIAMAGAILCLAVLPLLNTSEIRSPKFRPFYRFAFWVLSADFILLGWIGQKTVETPFIEIGQFSTFLYFFYFLIFIPVIGKIESYLIK